METSGRDKLPNFEIAHFASFVGGRLEIEDFITGELLHGKIASIDINTTEMKIEVSFAWLAKNNGTPDERGPNWVAVESPSNFEAGISEYFFTGKTNFGGVMISARDQSRRFVVTFYPKDYGKSDGQRAMLDPDSVRNLVIT